MIKKIDCRAIANNLLEEANKAVRENQILPKLAIIRVGDDPSSYSYIKSIKRSAEKAGVVVFVDEYPEECAEEIIINHIRYRNCCCDGVMIQMPLPKHLDAHRIINEISPDKDVDGMTEINMGKLAAHSGDYFVPCTAQAVIEILRAEESQHEDLRRLNVALFGRSNVVGKPLALELLNQNATVTVCHSFSPHRPYRYTIGRNVVISAIGKARHFGWVDIDDRATEMIIDCGINVVNGKLQGDFDLDDVDNCTNHDIKATTVPGGVGLVTSAALMKNVIESAIRRRQRTR